MSFHFFAVPSLMTYFRKRCKVTDERFEPFEHQCGFMGSVRLRLPEALQESDTPLNGYRKIVAVIGFPSLDVSSIII
jgi:hypothetical protein